MSIKLDDLLVKKKEPVQVLDLSKTTANTKDELKKLLEKVPEFKIKPEKVKSEDVRIYDKKCSFRTPKKELKEQSFPFTNPIPIEMKSLWLHDLCSIAIQWKMLTSLRPKNKLDEEYYSKLVELGKFQSTSREREKKVPRMSYLRKSKNKTGVFETRIVSCRNCGEEFCSSLTCSQFAYDLYERENVTRTDDLVDSNTVANGQYGERVRKKKKMSKSKKQTRKKGRKMREKNGSPKMNVASSRSTKIGEKSLQQRKQQPKGQSSSGSKIRKSSPQKKEKEKAKQESHISKALQSRKEYSLRRPHLATVVLKTKHTRKSKWKKK